MVLEGRGGSCPGGQSGVSPGAPAGAASDRCLSAGTLERFRQPPLSSLEGFDMDV